jgi:intracellular sulfur oxidation DsrE/DsrF family protein
MSASKTDRRTLIGAGALAAGAGLVASATTARAGEPAGGKWTPGLEEKDAWMDIPGTRHRMVYDTISPGAFGEALFYAKNYYVANESGYGLKPEALGVIVIARHMSTPFAYADAVWAKYGAGFAGMMQQGGMPLEGDNAELAKTRNPLFAAKEGEDQGMQAGANISALAAKGMRFAVCGMATAFIAQAMAKDAGMSADALEAELKANLVPGAVIVPAGIVAVERAQQHGYAFAYVA